ncbi:MAG TPA: hypothetical protein VK789_10560 [Bryobacteraceae bacterium]|nr:hypothetical protein [Bryobacteraceae bacterium]
MLQFTVRHTSGDSPAPPANDFCFTEFVLLISDFPAPPGAL